MRERTRGFLFIRLSTSRPGGTLFFVFWTFERLFEPICTLDAATKHFITSRIKLTRVWISMTRDSVPLLDGSRIMGFSLPCNRYHDVIITHRYLCLEATIGRFVAIRHHLQRSPYRVVKSDPQENLRRFK